jgi:hypothetical protein
MTLTGPNTPIKSSMIDLGVDFETYYDGDYSLKKMENAQYVMDARFEIIGVSVKFETLPTIWVTGELEEIRTELAKIPWDKVRMISHNARFDASILEWRLGLKAAKYLCTMVGSRPHYVGKVGSVGLGNLAEYLKLGKKGDIVTMMQGLHREDLPAQHMADYAEYCKQDTDLSVGIAKNLLTILPEDELELIDLTLKKYLRPQLMLDNQKLVERIDELGRQETALLNDMNKKYGLELADFRSRTRFAGHLGKLIAVPMKPGKSKKHPDKQTYAFAKDDLEFKRLLAHQWEKVRDLVSAKLALSSTMEYSRLVRLLDLSTVMNGMLPVPLVYYGAHPGRLSGDEKINMQNLPRVVRDKATKAIKRGHLRFAVVAQPGYEIVAGDFSNIEARMVATLAEQWDLVEAFRTGRDVYAEFATKIYGYAIDNKTHEKERFVGKTCILGLGYGMGWAKFQLKMAQEGIIIDEREAKRIVYLYRETYGNIPKLWAKLEFMMSKFVTEPTGMFVWGPLTFLHERIILPNGMPIMYPDLKRTPDGLKFKSRKYQAIMDPDETSAYAEGSKIWGGHICENVSQGLARIVATGAELRLAKRNLRAPLQVHDELVYHIPKILVAQVIPVIDYEMTRPVEWLPNLPIAVEIHHGPTYGDAK